MITEKIIVGENTKYPLNGLLTLPDDTEKTVPAVVFVHGSGASNMDEKVGKVTPFKDIAEGLAKFGIASIRYDKRTFVHGFKLVKEKNVTVKMETIEDALLATGILKKDLRIDKENIFIIGHSMGAMLAPRKLEEIMVGQYEDVLNSTKGFVHWIIKKQTKKTTKMFDSLYLLTDEEAKKKNMGKGVVEKITPFFDVLLYLSHVLGMIQGYRCNK